MNLKSWCTLRKGDNWSQFAVIDGHIITGQNPQSGKAVAEKFLELKTINKTPSVNKKLDLSIFRKIQLLHTLLHNHFNDSSNIFINIFINMLSKVIVTFHI